MAKAAVRRRDQSPLETDAKHLLTDQLDSIRSQVASLDTKVNAKVDELAHEVKNISIVQQEMRNWLHMPSVDTEDSRKNDVTTGASGTLKDSQRIKLPPSNMVVHGFQQNATADLDVATEPKSTDVEPSADAENETAEKQETVEDDSEDRVVNVFVLGDGSGFFIENHEGFVSGASQLHQFWGELQRGIPKVVEEYAGSKKVAVKLTYFTT